MTLTCERPDRDAPKLVCGYPLPCPHHTVVVDIQARQVTLPPEVHPTPRLIQRFGNIIDALEEKPQLIL